MAAKKKSKSASSSMVRAPRAAAPMIIRETRTVAAPKHKKHKGGGGKGRVSSEKQLMGLAVAGLIIGYLDKVGADGKPLIAIPSIPVLGKAGSIALAAHFFGKGKPGLVTDVRNGAAVIAGYEMGMKGSISGDSDDGGALIRPGAARG